MGIIVLCIYILGYIVNYNVGKYVYLKFRNEKDWTNGERSFLLLMSFGSWVCVVVNLLEILTRREKNDEKTNW
jgi:hypothetical protein